MGYFGEITVVVVLPYIALIPLSEQQAGHQCVSDTSPLPPSLPDAKVPSLTLQNHSSLPPLSQTGGRTSLHVSMPIPYTSFTSKELSSTSLLLLTLAG